MKTYEAYYRKYIYPVIKTNDAGLSNYSYYKCFFITLWNYNNKELDKALKDNKILLDALEFYEDGKKYFKRDKEVDLNQTSAVLKSEYRKNNDLTKPNIFKYKVYECSARLKLDQGNTAREAINKVKK